MLNISVGGVSLIGLGSGCLSFVAYILYFRSILIGKTRPSTTTWFILTLIGSIIAFSHYLSGGHNTVWIALSNVLGPGIVGLLSIKFGEKKHSYVDSVCLVGAFVCIVLWYLFKQPFLTLLLALVVDFFGMLPTLTKAYLRPLSEDLVPWITTASAGLFNILAVEGLSLNYLVYPVYLLGVNGLVTFLLVRGRHKFNFR